MASFNGIKKKINEKLFRFRKKRNLSKFEWLSGEKSKISILSCNCIGGVLMNEYNMTFMTPTVNFFMTPLDFLVFVENLEKYLDADIHLSKDANDVLLPYPVFYLGDLKIFAVHYKTLEEFISSWNRRKVRINKDNIFVIFTDRDGFDPSIMSRIDALPYRKVMFSHLPYPKYDWVCYIKGFEKEEEIIPLTDYIGITGKRWYSKYPFTKVFSEMSKVNKCNKILI